MLKVDIPINAPDLWLRIEAIRKHDICFCAPLFKLRLERMMDDCKKVGTLKTGEIFDPIIFETERTDELQHIYYMQGTTKAKTAIYGWHFYRLAVDVISLTKQWKVSTTWWRKLRDIAVANDLLSGYDWTTQDLPHIYFTSLKKSPSDQTRIAYFNTKNWIGKRTFVGVEHEEGLRRVHALVGAL